MRKLYFGYKFFCGILIVFSVSGCTGLFVHYDSNPRGASLICGNKHMGYTPVVINYSLDEQDNKTGILNIDEPCKAKWISGVEYEYTKFVNTKVHNQHFTEIAQRPNVEGYEKDARFALEVEILKNQKLQISAMQSAAAAAESAANELRSQNFQIQQQNSQLQQLNNTLMYK